jgi:hypothetical protein
MSQLEAAPLSETPSVQAALRGERPIGPATMNEPVSPLTLRPHQAARVLNISVRTLWGLTVPRGPIPCLRVGHGRRKITLYVVDDLKVWLGRETRMAEGGAR